MNLNEALARVEEAKSLFDDGRLNDAAEAVADALGAIEEIEPRNDAAHAAACELLADVFAEDCHCCEASELYDRAAASAERAGDEAAVLRIRLKHAIELQHHDVIEAAVETFETHLPAAIELLRGSEEWREVVAVAQHSYGLALEELQRCEDAAEAFLAAAQTRLDGPQGEQARHAASIALRLAAESRAHTDDLAEAEVLARRAVDLGRAGGAALGTHLYVLARILEAREATAEAAAVALEAVDEFEEELTPDHDAHVHACLIASRLHDELGDGSTALELASAAVELCENATLRDLADTAAAHEARAEALVTLGCAAEAGSAWREAVRHAREYAEWEGGVDSKCELARRLRRLARHEAVEIGMAAADPVYDEIRTTLEPLLADERGARQELAASLGERAGALAVNGCSEDGAASFVEAVAIAGDEDLDPLIDYWRGMPADIRREMHRHLPQALRFALKP